METPGSGFRVFRVSGFRVEGLGFTLVILGCRVGNLGFRAAMFLEENCQKSLVFLGT